MTNVRREFLKGSGRGAALLLSFSVGGGSVLMSPGEAYALDLATKQLSRQEADTLALLGEALVPGARSAGVALFIDQQCAVDPDECLLIAKYFQVPPPYETFYRDGVKAMEILAKQEFGKTLAELDSEMMTTLLRRVSQPGTKVEGIDAFMFYMCLRSDAVDVVYGTPEGFEKLNVPYMAHIMPPKVPHG